MSQQLIQTSVRISVNFKEVAESRLSDLNFASMDDYISALIARHCIINYQDFSQYLTEVLPIKKKVKHFAKKYKTENLLVPFSPSIILNELPPFPWLMNVIGITNWRSVKISIPSDLEQQINQEANKYRVSPGKYISFLLAKDICNHKAYMFYRGFFDPIWCVRIITYFPDNNRTIPLMWKQRFKIKDSLPETHPSIWFKENKYNSLIEFLEPESELIMGLADNFYK